MNATALAQLGGSSKSQAPSSREIPSSNENEVPLFRSTEDAEIYGRELRRVSAPDEFQALVRTWFVAQLAASAAKNLQAKALLAFRCQTLREAVQAFLFPDGAICYDARSLSLLLRERQLLELRPEDWSDLDHFLPSEKSESSAVETQEVAQ